MAEACANREILAKDKEDAGSAAKSLAGVIPDKGKTLEEYRDGRLRKYGIPDWHEYYS